MNEPLWYPSSDRLQYADVLEPKLAQALKCKTKKAKSSTEAAMRNFILGVMVGTLLTTIGVQAAGKEGMGNGGRPLHLNDERERQFQLQLDHIRKQTELEQARMQGRKNPC
jgi:hypothetical protein